jgi:two-component system cell cycle response regulator PopA
MAVSARVLLVGREDTLIGPLADGLDRLGWRSITARGPYAATTALTDLQIEAAIIDAATTDDAPGLAHRLKAAVHPRRFPIIAIADPATAAAEAFDLMLAAPLHPAQAAMRLDSLVRAAIAEEELELRQATFTERGKRLASPSVGKRKTRILAVGEPAPKFLGLSNALKAAGAEVVGAFTAYTAFDYLHEKGFDAVVLWAGDNQQEALSIAAGMRRNTRLYHVPTLLCLSHENTVSLAEAYHRGVSDIAAPDTPDDQTAARVLELARAFRLQNAVRQTLETTRTSGLMDVGTGLFSRDVFAAHLSRLAKASQVKGRPLSICVLRIADSSDLARARAGGWIERATPQIGSMIGRLVRTEDTAARLAPEVFALALPATPAAAARASAERIAAVIACTAFESGEGNPPFVVEFDIGVAQVESGETAGRTLERAAAQSLQKKAG